MNLILLKLISYLRHFSRVENVTNLSQLHSCFRNGAGLGGRISRPYWSWKFLWRIITFYIGLQLWILGGVTFLGLIVYSLHGLSVSAGLSSYHSWIPFSLSDLATFTGYVILLCFGWSLMVIFNHWNDMAVLLFQNTDIISTMTAIASYFWVANVSVLVNFVKVLLTDPVSLPSTVVIKEIILMIDNIGGGSSYVYNLVLTKLPLAIGYPFALVGEVVSSLWTWSLTHLQHTFLVFWNLLTSTVSGFIIPTVNPIFQPVVTSHFSRVSTLIAGTILMWLIRVIFRFPF